MLAISGVLAAHHTDMGIGAMHHDAMSTAIDMCLGVLTAVGTAVAAVAAGLLALGRWPSSMRPVPAGALFVAGTRAPEARAGPPPLSQLCVWRR